MKDLKHFNSMKLREKYSIGNLNKKNNYSSFWLGDNWEKTTSFFDDEDEKPGVDLIALSSYRRAIANFVKIVTSKNIPVTFTSQGDSFTDGKKVTISAKLDDKLFEDWDILGPEIKDLVNTNPKIARALIKLGDNYKKKDHEIIDKVEKLSGKMVDNRKNSFPGEVVSDFIQENKNYFPKLEEFAETIFEKIREYENIKWCIKIRKFIVKLVFFK